MTAEEFILKNAFNGKAQEDPMELMEAYAKQEAEKAWDHRTDYIEGNHKAYAYFETYWQHRNDKEEAKPDHCHCNDKYIDRSISGKILCKTCGKEIC